MSQGYTISSKQIQLTRQGAQAVAYKGPTDNQLSKILNSPAESAIPSMKIVRWMAAQILSHNGYEFSTVEPRDAIRDKRWHEYTTGKDKA